MPVAPQIGSKQEEILHFAGVRLRVTGAGNLRLTFFSLDNVDSESLVVLPMSSTNAREPTRLANFISQRGMVKIGTTAKDETFKINRVIVFTKPLWSNFPG